VVEKPEGNKPPDDVCTDASRCEDIKIDLKPFGTQHYTLYLLECKTRLFARPKNKTWTNPPMKNHKKKAMNSDGSNHRYNTNVQNTCI
jgi:hypothetical protein